MEDTDLEQSILDNPVAEAVVVGKNMDLQQQQEEVGNPNPYIVVDDHDHDLCVQRCLKSDHSNNCVS